MKPEDVCKVMAGVFVCEYCEEECGFYCDSCMGCVICCTCEEDEE